MKWLPVFKENKEKQLNTINKPNKIPPSRFSLHKKVQRSVTNNML